MQANSWHYSFSEVSAGWEVCRGAFAILYPGEKLALLALGTSVLIGGCAAINRLLSGEYSWPLPRDQVQSPKRAKGFGLKYIALILLAFVPGGFVATFLLYSIMGKEGWRRDSILILGISLCPLVALLVLRQPVFPWPAWRDAIFVSGVFGLTFAVLQGWVMLKLLRQWWGEPEESVPWWPPLALMLQVAMLAGGLLCMLDGQL